MYSRNSFGSYYPINSTIHRLNPVMKLINFVIAILILLLISLSVVTLKISNIKTRQALDDFSKCKVILDYDCLEYGNCRCR